MRSGKLVIAVGGGRTAVINQSLVAVSSIVTPRRQGVLGFVFCRVLRRL